MGRLFWKFFIVLGLAHLLVFNCAGLAFWYFHQQRTVDTSPPFSRIPAIAAQTLHQQGKEELRDLLATRERLHEFPPLYAIDEQNQELLGRPISTQLADEVRKLSMQPGNSNGVERVVSKSGEQYLIFVPGPGNFERPGVFPSTGLSPGPIGPPMAPGSQQRSAWDFRLPSLIPLLIGSLITLLSSALLAWYFSKPIKKLKTAFEAASEGRFDERLAPQMGKRRDELADLGRDFDRMAERLKALLSGQRRLLHDVSHELRSPLARLQLAIGLLRQQPETVDASLIRIEREAERMNLLVGELLTLSRVEAGMMGHMDEKIELNDLLAEIADDANFEAQVRDCSVNLRIQDQVCVRGNAELLHRAVENVVRNAVKHSPDARRVDVELKLETATQTAQISVADQGAGVPPSHLDSIFEPFFRSNNANTLDGHGLGLALSRQVIVAHGGTIGAQNLLQGGLCILIKLPQV